jgi:hypothetical protein
LLRRAGHPLTDWRFRELGYEQVFLHAFPRHPRRHVFLFALAVLYLT